MKYTVRTTTPRELTRAEVVILSRLSYRKSGYLWYDLRECINYDVGSVVICYDADKVVGWALMVPTRPPAGATFQGLVTEYGKRRCKYEAQFYVRSPYRKRGIGGVLMRAVNQIEPRPWVYPSPTNAGFFSKYTVSCENSYRKAYLNGYKKKSKSRRPTAGARRR